eukprot:8283905-Alexandrium_andersonii.AAC.1
MEPTAHPGVQVCKPDAPPPPVDGTHDGEQPEIVWVSLLGLPFGQEHGPSGPHLGRPVRSKLDY